MITYLLLQCRNKLDGSVKNKDYDEKVVAWNDLYLPDACFRLDEILSSAASQVHPQTVQYERVPVSTTTVRVEPIYVDPELPNPTQYTIPTTPTTNYGHSNSHSDQYPSATYTSAQVLGGEYSSGKYFTIT